MRDAIFPQHGKSFREFSTVWKKCFHTMEKLRRRMPPLDVLSGI